MIDKNAVRTALRTLMLNEVDHAVMDEELVETENETFKPPSVDEQNPQNSMWVREKFMWGQEPQIGYGYLELHAVAKYDVICPAGSGTREAEMLAKLIGDVLHHGLGLHATNEEGEMAQISIQRSEVGHWFTLDTDLGSGWAAVPVMISFRAYGVVPGAL